MENRKAQLLPNQIIMIFIFIGILGLFIVAYFAWSLMAPLVLGIGNTMSNTVIDAMPQDYNLSTNANMTIGAVNRTAQGTTEWITYALLFVMLISFGVSALFVRSYPFLGVFWILGMIVLAFVSVYLSVTYTAVSSGNGLTETYQGWAINDILISYLPHLTIGFAVLGGIILFVLSIDNQEISGGYI